MSTVAILGGGQLARMLALAGHPLGIRCRVLDPAQDCPAQGVAEVITADWLDAGALDRLAEGAVVATLLTMVVVPLLYWELRRRQISAAEA